MPEIAAANTQPWREAGAAQAANTQPWREAGAAQSVGSAYARAASGATAVAIDSALTAVNTIPNQPFYEVANTLEVIDLRNSQVLPVESVSLSLPDGSALWSLRAVGPKELAWKLMVGDQPATVEVRVNGEPWQFVIEQVEQPQAFESGKANVQGRSLAALAGAPYWGASPLIADAPTSAAQVCVIANTLTGLELDWRLEDWGIGEGEWATVADPVEVIRQMAGSVGAVVEAARSGMGVRVSPRYPEMPRYWVDRKPMWEIPWAAVERATTQRLQGPAYDGIVVTGQSKGDVLAARLIETAGNNQAPMVSDTNLTDEPALRQRAETELGAAGVRAMETRVLQVHGQVIERGDLVRCAEPLATWTGMVRSVNVEARHGWARQTLGIERDDVDFILPGDPLWSKVLLLLGFNGANFSTLITDESSYGDFAASYDSGVMPNRSYISDAQSKFGGSSFVVNEAGQTGFFFSSPRFARSAGQPYMIEGWFLSTARGAYTSTPMLLQITDGFGQLVFTMSAYNNASWGEYFVRSGQYDPGTYFNYAVGSGTWVFLQISWDESDVLRVHMNNQLMYTAAHVSWPGTTLVRMGGLAAGGGVFPCQAFFEEWRITKGAVRPIGVPAAPFPRGDGL